MKRLFQALAVFIGIIAIIVVVLFFAAVFGSNTVRDERCPIRRMRAD